jgi:hypothetical protein
MEYDLEILYFHFGDEFGTVILDDTCVHSHLKTVRKCYMHRTSLKVELIQL